MPPKTTFTKEVVLDASLQVLKNEGIQGISARNIAKQLQSSTAPVYSCFSNIDELKSALLDQAFATMLTYLSVNYTTRAFLNLGIGFVLFAGKEKELFRSLFLSGGNAKSYHDRYIELVKAEMRIDLRFTIISDDEKFALLERMWVSTFGLASMVCNEVMPAKSQEDVMRMLTDLGNPLANEVLQKRRNELNKRV